MSEHNSVEHYIEENKNLSQGLQELIYKANTFAQTAAEIILEAYNYAIKVDGYEPIEAAKILKTNLDYSPQWINKQLPDEAKTVQKRPLKYSNDVKRVSHNLQEKEPKDEIIITPTEIEDVEIVQENDEYQPNKLLEDFRNKHQLKGIITLEPKETSNLFQTLRNSMTTWMNNSIKLEIDFENKKIRMI